MTRRIVTIYAPPPVPWRSFDWSAHDDRLGEDTSPIGYGATEAEALADFHSKTEDAA